jgi:hypothetical protein
MITMAWRTKLILLAGVTLVALCLTMAFAASSTGAAATPGATAAAHRHSGGTAPATRSGDNGTVKIHRSTTPVTDPRNEPHVCVFYLDAFGFDAGQSVSWQIKSWPPTGDRTVVSSGVLALDTNGDGHTGDMTLANGHYKLYWNFTGEHGFAKQKVFWVACPAPTPTGTPTPSPSGSPTPSPSGSPTPSPSVSPTPPSTATPSPSLAPSSPPPSPPSPSGLPITGWPLGLIAAAGAALLGTGGTVMVAARRRRGLHGR